jgi:broad specificity phosphatase PhoE
MDKYILTKNIYLLRHGETDWNKLHKRQGCENDIQLNNTGRQQAELVGNYLSNSNITADLIISSSMSRANETAQIIAKKINYQLPILIIDNLKEVCHGDLSGLTDEDIKSDPKFDKYLELENIYKKEKDPIKQRELFYEHNKILNNLYGVELFNHSRHRFKKALMEIYNREEKNIIVVAHGGTIIQLLQIITNINDYIQGDYRYGSNCHMSFFQVFEKKVNNKIKRKIKVIKYLTSLHLKQ